MEFDEVLTIIIALYYIAIVIIGKGGLFAHLLFDILTVPSGMLLLAAGYHHEGVHEIFVPILVTGASASVFVILFQAVGHHSLYVAVASWFAFCIMVYLDLGEVGQMIVEFDLLPWICLILLITAAALIRDVIVIISDTTRTYDGGRSRRRWP